MALYLMCQYHSHTDVIGFVVMLEPVTFTDEDCEILLEAPENSFKGPFVTQEAI